METNRLEVIKYLSEYIDKDMAINIEKNIYDTSYGDNITYDLLCKRVVDNLDLIKDGLDINIVLNNMPYTYNEKWAPIKMLLDIRKQAKLADEAVSDNYTCKKCGNVGCILIKKQIKRADEPESLIVKCPKCKSFRTI